MSVVAPCPAGSFAQGELLSGFAHKSQGLTEIQFAAEKCWFRLWKNNSLVGVLGGERGGQGTGGALPFPAMARFARDALSLNENKCKTDRYICNPLPG